MIFKAFKTKKQRKRQVELLLTVFFDSFLIDLFLHLFGSVPFKLDKILIVSLIIFPIISTSIYAYEKLFEKVFDKD
ncbi:Uncharacterised protein [Streptococcus pneumoniae]|uniref:hypothetical protein n=1 Tax=Streptococcus pneumoniae TaxID=1313 RepID=UPI0010DCDEEC|nr:hypothetical protein [Streptococcus pneumoniae]MDH7663612.1 hypothetical protein [Streptococcus pneumoniae]CAG5350160.1 Uncharacterised protein [Streptococcus pneumoniae]VIV38009.1 Uncharacterised protein [Streptococcus pneumoniae]VMJ28416.1 Uncharacterised protein [Streptococcus pneumoniae]VMX76411.1 Uncharacterised protein [Streptococcus pneumoniae]